MKEMRAKHGNLEVCKVGHFGEINEMDDRDITARKAGMSIFGAKRKLVVDIDTPDIGPEPD